MAGFTPAAVHNPSIAVTATRRPFLLLSNIFNDFIFPWHLFTVTNGCILLYSVDKIHPLAQVHTSPARYSSRD